MSTPYHPDLVILCYHAVSDDWPSEGAIGPGMLDRQLSHLLKRRYRPLTLSAAFAENSEERAFVVTFDDAFHSVIESGLPVLNRHGVPATLFVPTNFASEAAPINWSSMGRWIGTRHERELNCMSWDDVRRLAAAGWEIGSHTRSHPDLTVLDCKQATTELVRSKAACEAEIQRACSSLAYPYGSHDGPVVELARSAGYGLAVTLGRHLIGPRSRGPLELSREGIYRTTRWSHFLAATSPTIAKARNSRPFQRLAAP